MRSFISTDDKLTGRNQVLKTSGLTSERIAARTSSQTVFCMEMAFKLVKSASSVSLLRNKIQSQGGLVGGCNSAHLTVLSNCPLVIRFGGRTLKYSTAFSTRKSAVRTKANVVL